MPILPPSNELFDDFILSVKKASKESAAQSLEILDKHIYLNIDHRRFRLVRNSPRTILTTIGAITFRRRYYEDLMADRDAEEGHYVCPLDEIMGLPRYSRYSNELRIKAIELATVETYARTGSLLSSDFSLAKSTVWRIVRDAKPDFITSSPFFYTGRVHLQIDEKYVGDASSSKKKRYITATIFTGETIVPGGSKTRKKLLNRTIISSFDISILAKKINQALIKLYRVTVNDTIWLSGDLASYIRNFPERITCCTAIYVPDKWHVCKFLSDGTNKTIRSKDVKRYLNRLLVTGDVSPLTDDGLKVMKLYIGNREIFDPWIDKRYLGCCQEGMNSHYYAPRFGKYANRFNESTLEKLASIKEAKENGWKTILLSKSRRPRESHLMPLGKEYEEPIRFDIDTSEMKYETRKYFDTVRYGG